MVEHSWQDTFSQLLNAPTFPHLIIRYVDNRFVLFDVSQVNNTALQLFSSLDFYGPPVELETVDDGHFLGFQADPANRAFEYITPPPQQIRDFSSAGSLRLRLSGLQSRSHLVAQYSYPKMLTEPALKRLIQVYMAKGFSRQDCMKFIRHSERWDLNFLFKKLCVSVCSPCFWLCVFVWFLLFFWLVYPNDQTGGPIQNISEFSCHHVIDLYRTVQTRQKRWFIFLAECHPGFST